MQQAARIGLASAAALSFAALAALTNCGGTSGERPRPYVSGGTGGSTSTGLNCDDAVVPENGIVTDFQDWKSPRWGSTDGLYGTIYRYSDSDSNMTAAVEAAGTETFALHATGSVVDSSYGGVGLGFLVCTTVAKFSQIQFDIMGSSPGCDLELQVKTYDQQPTSDSAGGGCDSNAGDCYQFPVKKQVVDLSTPIDDFTTFTVPFADIPDWSDDTATQVVGLQWQWTGTHVELDAGAGCPIDVMITNVKFLP